MWRMRIVRRRAVRITRTRPIWGRYMRRTVAVMGCHCGIERRGRGVELLVGRLGRSVGRGSIWGDVLRVLRRLQGRLRRPHREVLVGRWRALMLRWIGRRAGRLTRWRVVAGAASVGVHDVAQIHGEVTEASAAQATVIETHTRRGIGTWRP